MTTERMPRWHVSGPHSGDYYLLQDEQSDHIFATHLAEYMRAFATARLVEMWVDDMRQHVWYVFEEASAQA